MPATDRYSARGRFLAVTCLAGLSLLAGCEKKQAAAAPPPPKVGVITIHTQPVLRTTSLPGRTASVMTAPIIPQVSGVILKRLFVEGSDVKAGQQLYQIDPAPYQATYDSAIATLKHDEAALVADRAQAARYKPLAAAQAVSQQSYDNAVAAVKEDEANIASAKAAIETARINLQYTKVLAPISGTIGASAVTPGALVTADQSTSLATITTLNPIYVDVNESSTTWLRLKQEKDSGQLETTPDGSVKVTLTLEDGSTYSQTGKLQFSEVNVNESTGTVLVRALFPNPQHLLLPGMYVHAKIDEGMNKDGILVPQQAVSRNTRGDAVVLVVNSKNIVSQKVITIGRNIGSDWVVTGGLKAGEKVIVDGLMNATPGQPVSPTDETAKYAVNGAA
ncbi:efflux RND transporter periplasmic adaptor subunit [Acidocella aminolytica]|jgi:membrane fusion protein (multidrug efflux system)|uniref:Multidrug resistance efflux pump acriflavin resistance protein n=1 Tax=Acidocella aminolytica 101 = DSM 11237 TaxID=1120923 RepID=A0A0D6PDW9_9PROT|nr:efflux RND transporter periplasmic adaptor subunit [Acidocella aminolytica]GAN79955.1 multidrug resistance efflux pump acriflavin resistance protein [Acidocella aminolytica 101 = DSM 11237]GBQ38234.1 multidrug efflux pump acriflavin resistance protein AcrB/AcrD/AcrF [Acidocella aminolytica 101 = DSM 11237]SHE58438.1 membrane fusion protein, multidrug efflux system [Acidocella aminolytica 101 = DSM 11237]